MIEAGVVVGEHGRRLVDEAHRHDPRGGRDRALRDARRLLGGLRRQVWNGAATPRRSAAGRVPVNPTVVDEGGTLIVADSIAALAEAIPAPMGELERTVERYNAALAAGTGRARDPAHRRAGAAAAPAVPRDPADRGRLLHDGRPAGQRPARRSSTRTSSRSKGCSPRAGRWAG